MATKKAKTTKKTAIRSKATRISAESGRITAGAATLWAGSAVILIGTLQNNDDIKLLLVGFGAALLVLGGVLVGMSTKPLKK